LLLPVILRERAESLNAVFRFVVVVCFVSIIKRHISFWIATGLQRAPRNDDQDNDNGK
jgi:hypothetical protein